MNLVNRFARVEAEHIHLLSALGGTIPQIRIETFENGAPSADMQNWVI